MVMINTMQEIVDLDGKPIEEKTGQNLTLGRVMSNALMQPARPGKEDEKGRDEVLDYKLALRLRDPEAAQPVMLSVKEAAYLIEKVKGMGHRLVTAQVTLALDPPEKDESGEEKPERSKPRAVR